MLKATLLKVAAAAAGVILTLCLIGASVLWYVSRPKPPRPWNDKALIVKEPPGFGPSSEDKTVYFSYSVQNDTAADYAVENVQQLRILAITLDDSLSSPIDEEHLVLRTPIFIPSHQKGTITVRLKVLDAPEQNKSESDDAYHERLRQYLNDHIAGVRGFVLFDETNRYRINLPAWSSKKPENK